MNKTTPVALAALSALALVGGAAITGSTAQAAVEDQRGPQQRAGSARLATAPVTCDGGAGKGLLTRLQPEPFAFSGTAGADVAVPGAQVEVRGPKKGTDTLLISFTAETYYSGSGWMSLEVHKDGVPIGPYADNGSPLALTSQAAYGSHGAQFCTKVGKGRHTLAVQTSTTGDSTTDTGWIDDWTFSVQRFD